MSDALSNAPEIKFMPDEHVIGQLVDIAAEVFPEDKGKPILGINDGVIVADGLEDLIKQDTTVLETIKIDEDIVGFGAAIPIGLMNPERKPESSETVYIYYDAIKPVAQGLGLIAQLNQKMFQSLRERGYRFAEIDCVIGNGYADKFENAYQSSIVEKRDHEGFAEIGPQRFFRIAL